MAKSATAKPAKDKAAAVTGVVLFVGGTMTLPLSVFDQDGAPMNVLPDNVSWVSSNPGVASVQLHGQSANTSGILTGVSEGQVEVSAIVASGMQNAPPIVTLPLTVNVVRQVVTTATIDVGLVALRVASRPLNAPVEYEEIELTADEQKVYDAMTPDQRKAFGEMTPKDQKALLDAPGA